MKSRTLNCILSSITLFAFVGCLDDSPENNSVTQPMQLDVPNSTQEVVETPSTSAPPEPEMITQVPPPPAPVIEATEEPKPVVAELPEESTPPVEVTAEAETEPSIPEELPETTTSEPSEPSRDISVSNISIADIEEPITPENATTLTEADNDGAIAIESGSILIINLKGNPTTGYTWSVEDYDNRILTLEGHNYVPDTDGRVGGGGVFQFQFKSLSPGSTDVTLGYARPWEKDQDPAQTFKSSVTVK